MAVISYPSINKRKILEDSYSEASQPLQKSQLSGNVLLT